MANFIPDTSNTLFQLAAALVNQSSRNIFLTGKAGTGKTTFLKYIRENCPKQMAVVAPTGIAAINAGGVTIHSFFQLPLSPFIPQTKGVAGTNGETVNRHSLISRLRINTDKKKLLQQLELLIIDEISMVRCDTIDAIDTVLRYIRNKPLERFGGVQLLFIGDLFQLPPVIREQEWGLLSEFYSSPYFFAGKVMEEEPPLYIEFNKIYRQSEEKFIRLLNQVRNNELDEEGLKLLDERFNPAFRRSRQDGYIILTTHNEKAREINGQELHNIDGPAFSFEADIEDEFPENAYPADHTLYLKTGAQVMFIRNDLDRNKRYFNGKIGIVSNLAEDRIFVQCENDPEEIEVKREKWENVRYSLNNSTRTMEENTLGSFSQFPLRLAWAITIHKSQGLTFEKAIIDAGAAFAPGQVYVALSRCSTLEGMILRSKINANRLLSDPRIVQFSQRIASSQRLQEELVHAKRNYQLSLLVSSFDFADAVFASRELAGYLSEHHSSFNPEAGSWLSELIAKLEALQATALKFHRWLESQFQQPDQPENNLSLLDRLRKAIIHFTKELEFIIDSIYGSPVVTDSRLHAKEFNDQVREIFAGLSLKQFLIQGMNGQIDIEAWQKRKKNFILPSLSVNAYAAAAGSPQKLKSPHPQLHQQLRKLRETICSRKDLPIYIVAGTRTIDEMAMYLPQTLAELRKISGFGDAKIDQYGQLFLDVILQYCKENSLSSGMMEKLPKREKKEKIGNKKNRVDTKAESFRLFNEGNSPDAISKIRNLSRQTIEGHLAHYVASGDIEISKLVTPEKLLQIDPLIRGFTGGPVTPVKEQLGDAFSFGEIRLAIAWQQYKNNIGGTEGVYNGDE